jgi:hypothetical protein
LGRWRRPRNLRRVSVNLGPGYCNPKQKRAGYRALPSETEPQIRGILARDDALTKEGANDNVTEQGCTWTCLSKATISTATDHPRKSPQADHAVRRGYSVSPTKARKAFSTKSLQTEGVTLPIVRSWNQLSPPFHTVALNWNQRKLPANSAESQKS